MTLDLHQGLRFGVWGGGCRVWGLEVGGCDLGFKVEGLNFGARGLGFRFLCLMVSGVRI